MPERLPEGNGIAEDYPGDVGIENDPAVVFVDGFEEIEDDTMAALGKDQKGNRWDTCANTVTIVTDSEQVHSGSKAAQVTFEKVGSHNAVKQFKPGFDALPQATSTSTATTWIRRAYGATCSTPPGT
jgi:hypothetical protein